MQRVTFLGDSRRRLRAFPSDARMRAGFELGEVQRGREPTDWKPMTSVGSGVREIRVRAASGAFRVIYVAVVEDAIVVLHAFQKKTQKTARKDIDLAAQRLKTWKGSSDECRDVR